MHAPLPSLTEVNSLVFERRLDEAIAGYDRRLAVDPTCPQAWSNRGICLQTQLKFEEALDSYCRAIQVAPQFPIGYINAGVVLSWTNRYEAALAAYDSAIMADNRNVGGWIGKVETLRFLGRLDEAIEVCNEALKIDQAEPRLHYAKSLALLSKGDYVAGFREHEWRFGEGAVLGPHRFGGPIWDGSPTDRTVLIHCEQGLGDSIQFSRYLHGIKGQNYVLEAHPALYRLFAQTFPDIRVIDGMGADHREPFDYHCPILTLSHLRRTTIDTMPLQIPYLHSAQADRAKWAPQVGGLPPTLTVGVSWASGVRPENAACYAFHKRKSLSKALAERLVSIPGVNWVSLQKEPAEDGPIDGIHDWTAHIADMADTAALVDCLDMVVTVDSAPAHLAAALGVPTIVMSRHDVCWRWRGGDIESPWYPSVQVVEQDITGDWSAAIDQVHASLKQRMQAVA